MKWITAAVDVLEAAQVEHITSEMIDELAGELEMTAQIFILDRLPELRRDVIDEASK